MIHTEEVTQIALSLGRKLELNLELITAIAKAHDLGHAPFGHAGERTLQVILERELSRQFDIKLPKSENERELFRKKIFHHSLNSARILIKEKEFENVPNQVIEGVLTHSWSPWKQKNDIPIPTTYEAQTVAIADQLSSINHDIEDIIEGKPYTGYDKDMFIKELKDGFKNKHPEIYNKLKHEINNFLVPSEKGYGRENWIRLFVKEISENTLKMFQKNDITQSNQAKYYPICLSNEWAIFLDYCEKYIRNLIQERIPWFIARDHMAGAIISTVFYHIWARARDIATPQQMTIPMYTEEDAVKAGHEEETKYREHFANFFREHYYAGEKKYHQYEEYLATVEARGIKLWDINIRDAIKNRTSDEEERLIRLVAVVDFIAGLTDRYCLEIFDEVYKQFVIT